MDNPKTLGRLVYGSNMIESAGGSLDITTRLCKAVFAGQVVNAHIDERDDEEYYQGHVEHLRHNKRPTNHVEVIQSRREMIQHAQALQYTIRRIVTHREPLSESLIREAHRILHTGLDNNNDATPSQYRTHEVAVKYQRPGKGHQRCHAGMRARAVPGYMKDMVHHLNHETAAAEVEGRQDVDPYALAARFHYLFLNMHPFGHGNGRIARVISSALLLRYAGGVSVLGATLDERHEYICIATRGLRAFRNEHKEVEFGRQKGHLELADYVWAKSQRGIGWSWASEYTRQEPRFEHVIEDC
jgi:fido (protein-threonine AMPylation protein)